MISETLRTWLLGIIAAGMVIGVLYALLLAGNVTPRMAEQVRSGLCLLLTVALLWLAICHGVTNLTFYGMLLYLLVSQFFVGNGKPHRIAS